jgi:hypothetical protein
MGGDGQILRFFARSASGCERQKKERLKEEVVS